MSLILHCLTYKNRDNKQNNEPTIVFQTSFALFFLCILVLASFSIYSLFRDTIQSTTCIFLGSQHSGAELILRESRREHW